jgi:hypothetical protein
MKTKVVNKNKEPYEIYIGRGSLFGNPFTHKDVEKTKAIVQCKNVKEAVEKYKQWVLGIIKIEGVQPPAIEKIRELKGKVLGCYCDQDKPCHGQVLAKLAESTDEEIEKIKLEYEKPNKILVKNIF